MLTIYGHAASSNVRKVLWTCHELGLAYRHCDATGASLTTTLHGYLAINPNGMVPAIDDDGFTLWESNVILRYLVAKQRRHDLLPENIAARAIVEQWMDWQVSDLVNASRHAFEGLTGKTATPPDRALIRASRNDWIIKMIVLEHQLAATGGHVASGAFTLADIPIGIAVNRWFMTPIERPALPQVQAYFDRLTEREGYRLFGRNGMP